MGNHSKDDSPLKRFLETPYAVPFAYAAALVFRLLLAPGAGFPTDIGAWERWADALVRVGPRMLYADTSGHVFPVVDYPPGYMYVLWGLGLVHHAFCQCFGSSDLGFRMLVKFPAIAADLGVAAVLRALTARVAMPRTATWIWLAALFLPPLPLISAYWGQVDSVAVLVVLGATLALLQQHDAPAWPLLTLGFLIKPQSAPLASLFLVWQFRARSGWRRPLLGAGLALAGAYALCVPFAPSPAPLHVFSWLVARMTSAVDKYPYASTGAFNVYGLADAFFTSDSRRVAGLSLDAWGIVLVGALIALVAALLWQRLAVAVDRRARERAFMEAAFVLLTGTFMLATRMHERYLLAGIVFGAVVAAFRRDLIIPEIVLASVFTVNAVFILAGFYGGHHHAASLLIARGLSALDVAAFAFTVARYIGRVQPSSSLPACAAPRMAGRDAPSRSGLRP